MILETVRFCRQGCRSWFCPECAYARGMALQAEWEASISTWSSVLLMTLTVAPRLFAGPGEAYNEGRQKIGLLMRDLRRLGIVKFRRWVGVMECHESGWPHFHLIVEADFIPHKILQSLWCRHGMIPPNGVVDLRKPQKGQSKAGMVRYVTKYLVKTPKGGWPDWVLESTGRIFRVLRCRGPIRPLTEWEAEMRYRCKLASKGDRCLEPVRHCGPRLCRSHKERVASCGGHTVVQKIYRHVKDDGEIAGVCVRYLGCFYGPRRELLRLVGRDPEGDAEVETAALDDLWGLVEGKRWIGNPHGICSYSSMAVH